jgi:hypothetical protein
VLKPPPVPVVPPVLTLPPEPVDPPLAVDPPLPVSTVGGVLVQADTARRRTAEDARSVDFMFLGPPVGRKIEVYHGRAGGYF